MDAIRGQSGRHRLPAQSARMNELPRSFKLLIIWLLIGTAVFLGAQALLRARAQPRISLGEGVVSLTRAADGHYHWPGQVNGQAVDFLIDTGATRSTIPGHLAEALGLPRGEHLQSQTAAGLAEGWRSTVDLQLQGGPSIQRLPVVVMPGMQGQPLLGMDVLGRLRLEQADGQLHLRPPGQGTERQ